MKVNNKEIASKILRSVPYDKAFYFFTAIGQYCGESAASLADFYQKMKRIDAKSVDFHFKRRDFQKWIRTTMGDAYLANEIDKIGKSFQGEELRVRLCQMVEKRFAELKRPLASQGAHR